MNLSFLFRSVLLLVAVPVGRRTFDLTTLCTAIIVTGGAATQAHSQACPAGYRLHYQGQCINKADELTDDPTKGVRMFPPKKIQIPDDSTPASDPLATTGYKFSNMKDGAYCKEAFVRISRSAPAYPVAFALGHQSCGFSDIDVASPDAAKARALAECKKRTAKCRIVLPKEK